MFYTFHVARPERSRISKPTASSESDINPSGSKRPKVFRACDRCRLYRVRCGERPCAQCISNKAICVTSSMNQLVPPYSNGEMMWVDASPPGGWRIFCPFIPFAFGRVLCVQWLIDTRSEQRWLNGWKLISSAIITIKRHRPPLQTPTRNNCQLVISVPELFFPIATPASI